MVSCINPCGIIKPCPAGTATPSEERYSVRPPAVTASGRPARRRSSVISFISSGGACRSTVCSGGGKLHKSLALSHMASPPLSFGASYGNRTGFMHKGKAPDTGPEAFPLFLFSSELFLGFQYFVPSMRDSFPLSQIPPWKHSGRSAAAVPRHRLPLQWYPPSAG